MEKFKDKIKALRSKRNITQQQLATDLNVSKQAVSKWEKGHSLPDVASIEMIASYFGVSTDYLLNDSVDVEGMKKKKSGFFSLVIEKEKLILRIAVCVLLAVVIALSVSLGIVVSRRSSSIPKTVYVNGWEVTLIEYEDYNVNGDDYWNFKFYVYNSTDFEKNYENGDVISDNSNLIITDDIYTGYMRIVKPKNGEYLNVRVYTYGFEARGSVTLLFYGTPILRFSYKDYGKNININ